MTTTTRHHHIRRYKSGKIAPIPTHQLRIPTVYPKLPQKMIDFMRRNPLRRTQMTPEQKKGLEELKKSPEWRKLDDVIKEEAKKEDKK
jgi:hypothetical protein